MNIGIIPSGSVYLKDKLFDKTDEVLNRDNCHDYLFLFKGKMADIGYKVNTYDMFNASDIDVLIVYRIDFMIGHLLKVLKVNQHCRIFYLMTEPPVICPMHKWEYLQDLPFEKIFTWNDAEIKKSNKIEKLNYVNPRIVLSAIPRINFSKKKLIATIAGNKTSNFKNELYSERLRVAEVFSKKNNGFGLYGRGWDKDNREWIKKVWCGEVANKKDTLKHYKFTLAFENSYGYEGYITEKIFDAFSAGSVPVYYGAQNISRYIPKSCYVDYSDFNDIEELYTFLSEMNEEEYNKYIESINDYLLSDSYEYFCSEIFTKILSKEILKKKYRTRISYLKIRIKLILNLVFKIKIFNYSKRYFFEVLIRL